MIPLRYRVTTHAEEPRLALFLESLSRPQQAFRVEDPVEVSRLVNTVEHEHVDVVRL